MFTKTKEVTKSVLAKLAVFSAVVMARANTLVYSDAFKSAENAVGNLQDKLVHLAEVIFPLAIVICAISMFFTRDQKKFDSEKRILIGCCLAFGLVVLVTKGDLVSTIQNLF